MNRGVTLIETLIYVGLFMLLLGSAVSTAFYLVDSSEKGKQALNTEAESEFFMQKLGWVLDGAQAINIPVIGASGPVLSVSKNGFSSNPLVIDVVSGRARLSRGGSVPAELTGDRVSIENLSFTHFAAVGAQPEAISASFTAGGKNFSFTKYLRK